MTPREAYDQAASRARRLLRLHDGLINLRRYRIRSDWKAAFCRLMRWRLASDLERVDTADALIVLRDGASLSRADFTREALDDLLRASLVTGVSALDRYVHERVVKKIVGALKKPTSRRQEEFSIPATFALQAADAVRRAVKDGRQARPANELRKQIQRIIHGEPYQSWRQIEAAFELIGVNGLAGTLQEAYGLGDISPVRRQLNGIVDKRNKIVHEGDLVRHERGGRARPNEIGRGYVAESLDFLDGFVDRLGQV